MDDSLCCRFFLRPTQTLQRRYELLRAFFVEKLSYEAIVGRFAVPYHTVRSLVRDFRGQCRAGQAPPFSPSPAADDPPTATRPRNRLGRR
jgi:hypothetical protein